MKNKLSLSCIIIGIGVILIILSNLEIIDSFYLGFGNALVFAQLFQFFKLLKMKKNPEYREKVEIAEKDERNKFLSMKAWSYAGYSLVMLSGIACIISMILKYKELCMIFSYIICATLMLYWISYLILKKKY